MGKLGHYPAVVICLVIGIVLSGLLVDFLP
jgi:hypothetical protein